MPRNTIRVLLGAWLLASWFADGLLAQRVSGTISGYVSDPQNAPVTGAAVTTTNVRTGVINNALTDTAGLYVITNLNPGEYTVAVEAAGFRRFLQEGVVLGVDSTVRIDPKLQIGAIEQEITVSAAPAMLKTEKTDVSQSISERDLVSLPTPGRNLSKLFNIIPGVVENIFQIGPGENPGGFNGVMVNGQFYGTNEFEIDGISDTACCFSNYQVLVPNQEAIQEMKITTTAYDPEFGSAAGMVAQHVTKSGTNQVHGSAFWFNRNKAVFAADPFTEKTPGTGKDGKGLGPAPFNWNQIGFSLGGPLKKNRMFWFGDYQANRTRQGAAIRATSPNDSFRNGDFRTLDRPIFDPLSGNRDGTGRLPFSCGAQNVICPDRINPVARKLLAIMPGPNLSQGTDVNFLGSGKQIFNQDQADVRYDANISDKDKFFARYTYFSAFLDNPPIFGKKAGGTAIGGQSPQTGDFRSQHTALNYTHTFGASLLSEVRLGLIRFRLDGFPADLGLRTDDEVGIPGINTSDPLTQGLAGIDVQGPIGAWFMGIRSGIGLPRVDRTTNIQVVNNWTKITGGHQFRWGGDVRRIRFDFFSLNASTRGNFAFCPTVTGSPSTPGSGLGMATFLLGLPCSFDRALFTIFPAERNTRSALYAQDIWRATPKLTVNYGLRWSYFSPIEPRFAGQLANFDPSSGDILLAGLGDVSASANVNRRLNDFAPRVGIAYRLLDRTVIRAGFGRSYFGSNFGGTSWFLTSFFPIAAQQTISQSNIYQGIFPIEQGPPAPTPPAFPASGHLKAPPGTLLKTRPFDNKTEYVDSWNFTVEHQLAANFRLSAAYVGNVGRHLLYRVNINAAPAGPGSLLPRRPYFPKFGLDTTIQSGCNCENTNYNALQLVLEKRFSTGYSFTSAFTWAKALDQIFLGSVQGEQSINPYDRRGNYGISTFNRAAVWTLSHTWALPYGRGLPFGVSTTGLKQVLFAGWNLNGITSVESGFPISPTLTDGSSLNGDFGQRPDVVLGVNPNDVPGGPSRDRWYTPAAFTKPTCCRWGNAGRSIMRGPGLVSADWALWKEFAFRTPLNERTELQFRWENFNFFNNTNLGQPVTAVDSSIAGRIVSLQGSLQGAGPGVGGLATMRRMQFGLRMSW